MVYKTNIYIFDVLKTVDVFSLRGIRRYFRICMGVDSTPESPEPTLALDVVTEGEKKGKRIFEIILVGS